MIGLGLGITKINHSPLALPAWVNTGNLFVDPLNTGSTNWSRSNVTPFTNYELSPVGSHMATYLRENAVSSTHQALQSLTVTAATSYTLHAIWKSVNGAALTLFFSSSTFTTTQQAYFSPDSTAYNITGGTPTVGHLELGGAWYYSFIRAISSGTPTNPQNYIMRLAQYPSIQNYLGDITKGIIIAASGMTAG